MTSNLEIQIANLIARGKKRGYVTYGELNTTLPQGKVTSKQIEDTMAMVSEHGINVMEDELSALRDNEIALGLSEDEVRFLATQGLSAFDVLDGRGLSQVTRKSRAAEQEKSIILGSRCAKAGHRLRTRYGHCAQCDTSKLAYQDRSSRTGYVYIAGSLLKTLIKVGGSGSIEDRELSLRKGYAGVHDWVILCWVKLPNYGRNERKTQDLLSEYAQPEIYRKGDNNQIASEVFRCSFSAARNALDEATEGVSIIERYMAAYFDHYEFS